MYLTGTTDHTRVSNIIPNKSISSSLFSFSFSLQLGHRGGQREGEGGHAHHRSRGGIRNNTRSTRSGARGCSAGGGAGGGRVGGVIVGGGACERERGAGGGETKHRILAHLCSTSPLTTHILTHTHTHTHDQVVSLSLHTPYNHVIPPTHVSRVAHTMWLALKLTCGGARHKTNHRQRPPLNHKLLPERRQLVLESAHRRLRPRGLRRRCLEQREADPCEAVQCEAV
jgi:hypothetical protein